MKIREEIAAFRFLSRFIPTTKEYEGIALSSFHGRFVFPNHVIVLQFTTGYEIMIPVVTHN
jgi:hypothetical protein